MKNFLNKLIHHPEKAVRFLGRRGYFNWMSDAAYIKLMYRLTYRRPLNLDNPETFSEKLQWLKLHDRNPVYSDLVDKYQVKRIVADKVGQEYVIPTLGVWDHVEDIDFSQLPDQFVLKCTHDSGGLVICRDKSKLSVSDAKQKLSACLKQRFFYFGREWPYKNVRPRIIAERYMEENGQKDLRDYKFYCFGGNPVYCQVISNRTTEETIDFFDKDWKLQGFTGLTPGVKNSEIPPEKPKQYEKMLEIAQKLSEDFPFVRIDLYEIQEKIYFGEITFYPMSGFGSFTPDKWNKALGDRIVLPMQRRV